MPDTRESITLRQDGTVSYSDTVALDAWEAPFTGQIVGVSAYAQTGPATTGATLDIRKNGTSVFGTVATLFSAIDATQTTIDLNPVTDAGDASGSTKGTRPSFQRAIDEGALLLIESEQVQLVGAEQGSPQGSGQAVYRINVTRGANSTTAAAHAANVAVTYAPPLVVPVASGSSETRNSGKLVSEDLGYFVAGDTIDLLAKAGGGTGLADLVVTLEVVTV